jgi:hypothetical protein
MKPKSPMDILGTTLAVNDTIIRPIFRHHYEILAHKVDVAVSISRVNTIRNQNGVHIDGSIDPTLDSGGVIGHMDNKGLHR